MNLIHRWDATMDRLGLNMDRLRAHGPPQSHSGSAGVVGGGVAARLRMTCGLNDGDATRVARSGCRQRKKGAGLTVPIHLVHPLPRRIHEALDREPDIDHQENPELWRRLWSTMQVVQF